MHEFAEHPGLGQQLEAFLDPAHCAVARSEAGVGPGQLPAGGQRREDADRVLRRSELFLAAAQPPQRPGQQPQILPDAQVVTELAPQLQRGAQRTFHLLPSVQQRILSGDPLLQGGHPRPVTLAGEPQRPLVLGRRLTMRAQRG